MIVITKKTHRLRVTLSDNAKHTDIKDLVAKYGGDNYQET